CGWPGGYPDNRDPRGALSPASALARGCAAHSTAGQDRGLRALSIPRLSHATARSSSDGRDRARTLFLGRSFVLTFQERPENDLFESVRLRLRQAHSKLRQSGADYLAYTLLDTAIDGFFPLLEKLGDRLTTLEEAVLEHPTQETMEEIYAVRRTLIGLRRVLWPLRQAVQAFGHDDSDLVTASTRLFLRDCYDHVLQVLDVLENCRELV